MSGGQQNLQGVLHCLTMLASEIHITPRLLEFFHILFTSSTDLTLLSFPAGLLCPQKRRLNLILHFDANLFLVPDLIHFAFPRTSLVL